MGTECEIVTNSAAAEPPAGPAASATSAATDEKEARFMTALQRIMGGAELTDDSVRTAIANLTPAQRQQLLAEGQDLKRDLLTKQEHAEERNLYFNEVNRSADRAGLPVDKDGAFLAKKVRCLRRVHPSLHELPACLLLTGRLAARACE
jgi:hypothetical protein